MIDLKLNSAIALELLHQAPCAESQQLIAAPCAQPVKLSPSSVTLSQLLQQRISTQDVGGEETEDDRPLGYLQADSCSDGRFVNSALAARRFSLLSSSNNTPSTSTEAPSIEPKPYRRVRFRPESVQPLSASDGSKTRKNNGSKRRKAARRERDRILSGPLPPLKSVHQKRQRSAGSVDLDLNSAFLPRSSPAWQGFPEHQKRPPPPTQLKPPILKTSTQATPTVTGMAKGNFVPCQSDVDKMAGEEGFTYVNWAGEARLDIVDSEGRVILCLAGKPRDLAGYAIATEAAATIMLEELEKCEFRTKDIHHRRAGPEGYATITTGVSHGGGRKQPGNVAHGRTTHANAAKRLKESPHIKRIVGFTNGAQPYFPKGSALTKAPDAFRVTAPELWFYYWLNMTSLLQWGASFLVWAFTRSVFAACTFNLGPRAVTCDHLDHANLAWGWCVITALCWFDPDRGGHLILRDLKLIIRFPAGSSIFLPSALLKHSNAPVQPAEKRLSFTQYTAGGLFRWVQNGFQGDGKVSMSTHAKATRQHQAEERWRIGLSMLPVYNKLSD
ncbi:unnamed protein product [Mycena citricolor]|uniref:Uncharacterized protein n=1 Tax=Mycena citricolor TaxID=2018698 RepID=A0AAD2HXM3_9AGAR|nr:unnamed protein product [Mycena citricolor]